MKQIVVKKKLPNCSCENIPQELNVHCIWIFCLRLHDYYKFDVERFVNEGVFETEQVEAYSNGDLTVWDAFKIGVKGANKMFLGSGLQVQKFFFWYFS